MIGADAVPRVLFFSPYGQWHYHGVQEATLAHALALRGAVVRTVTCDGVFPACDVYREGINPRDANSCLSCQAHTATLHADLGWPAEWLSRHVPKALHEEARAFAEALAPEELPLATWRGHPVGEWAQSSTFHQFRMSRFEFGDPRVVRGLRDHVAGTVLAVEGLAPLLDEWRPDVLVVLNGRFFAHRAALELARERGIRVVTHERGFLAGTLRFAENALIHDLAPFREIWRRWRHVPLSAEESRVVHSVLQDRRVGRGLPWRAYSPPPQDESVVRTRLGLTASRPLLAAFTSSDDESAAFPERRRGAFPDSLDWLPATVELARRCPEFDVVIRLHPNLIGAGTNAQALGRAAALRPVLPPNCRIVGPEEDISSYTLADLASVGLVYFSTLGLEMAARGQPVVSVARGWYGPCGFTWPVDAPSEYEQVVRRALAKGPEVETARRARRFAARLYRDLAVPFPLVVEEPRHCGKITYDAIPDLAPGRHDSLDRICAFVMDGTPLFGAPTDEQRARTTAEEDAFLAVALTGGPTPFSHVGQGAAGRANEVGSYPPPRATTDGASLPRRPLSDCTRLITS